MTVNFAIVFEGHWRTLIMLLLLLIDVDLVEEQSVDSVFIRI